MNSGKILLVGFGPGAAEHMTFRAREAILEADVVGGYATYIRLVEGLLGSRGEPLLDLSLLHPSEDFSASFEAAFTDAWQVLSKTYTVNGLRERNE